MEVLTKKGSIWDYHLWFSLVRRAQPHLHLPTVISAIFSVFSIWKSLWVLQKSFHQDCSLWYLHLVNVFLCIHSPLLLEIKSSCDHCFPQQIILQNTDQWYMLQDHSSVKISFNMINKRHLLPVVYTMLV